MSSSAIGKPAVRFDELEDADVGRILDRDDVAPLGKRASEVEGVLRSVGHVDMFARRSEARSVGRRWPPAGMAGRRA
jgi:hypothetical protein